MRSSTVTTVLRHHMTPRAIALELRRQERGSDFTGYTENSSFTELVHWVQEVGGERWQLSRVPLSRIRCWNTRTPVARLMEVIARDEHGQYHLRKVRKFASEIHSGRTLPGIVLTNRPGNAGGHWILSGYRRLAAHRIAHAATILAYHPADLFHKCSGLSDRPSRRRHNEAARPAQ